MFLNILKIKNISLLLLLCITAKVSSEEVCDTLHSVVYKYAVNHKNELTHFNVYPPLDCNEKVSTTLTMQWLKTACAHFSTKKPEKTYGRWRKPKFYYGFYTFDSKYPEIIWLPINKNSPEDQKHVIVLKSILDDSSDKHVCSGELLIHFEA